MATAMPLPRFTTTSLCRWPLPKTKRRKSAGALKISSSTLAACPKPCGSPKPPSTLKRWWNLSRPASSTPFFRPLRPTSSASWAIPNGPAAATPTLTPLALTAFTRATKTACSFAMATWMYSSTTRGFLRLWALSTCCATQAPLAAASRTLGTKSAPTRSW